MYRDCGNAVQFSHLADILLAVACIFKFNTLKHDERLLSGKLV